MNLYELRDLARDYSDLDYDPRISHIMGPDDYQKYKENPGHTYYLFLRKLIRILKPSTVVELGTSIGRSAAFMMLDLPAEAKLTTFEISSYRRTDLIPFELDPRLHMIYGDDTNPEVFQPLDLHKIDFLYIDSLHAGEHVKREFKIYLPMMKHGGIVVMDDININDGLREVWNWIPYEKVHCDDNVHFSGFGMFRFDVGLSVLLP